MTSPMHHARPPGPQTPAVAASIGALGVPPRTGVNARSEVLQNLTLPKPIELVTTGGELTPAFTALLRALHQQMLAALPPPPASKRESTSPQNCWKESKGGVPSSSEEFTKWIGKLPQSIQMLDPFTKTLATELFTLAADIYRNGGLFEKRQLFAHQQALFSWIGMALIGPGHYGRPNRTILLDAPHGSGKTQVMGLVHLASLRAHARSGSEQITTYVTSRGFSSSQQVVGLEQVRRMATHSYPQQITVADLKEMLRYVRTNMPEISERMPWSALGPMVQSHPDGFEDIKAARHAIEEHLGPDARTGLAPAAAQKLEKALTELSLWFCHQGALVKADDQGTLMMLKFPVQDTSREAGAQTPLRYAGDMVRGFPAEIIDSGLIFSRRFSDSLLEQQLKSQTQSPHDSTILANCVSAVLCEGDVQQGKRRTEVVDRILNLSPLLIFDEGGRRAGSQLQHLASNALEREPIVIAATYSSSRVMTLGFLSLSYDAISPAPDIQRAFEQGILPAVAERIYPAANQTHYPFHTREARQQILDAHFEELELYKALKLPQPSVSRTILVVPKSSVVDISIALQKEYDRRKIPGVVVPLSVNMGSRELERYTNRTLAWMIAWKDEHLRSNSRPPAQVLVTHPSAIIDGLDLPDVNVTLADPTSLNRDKVMRLLMRACRGHDPQTPNSSYRGLITVHRFVPDSESSQIFSHTPSSILDPSFKSASSRNSGSLEHLRGAVIVPSPLALKEKKLAGKASILPVSVPFALSGLRNLITETGSELPVIENNRAKPQFAPPDVKAELSLASASIVGARMTVRGPGTQTKLGEFSSALDRKWSQVEDLNHACVVAEAALPEDWKASWRTEGQALRDNIRSYAYRLSREIPIFDRKFGELVGHEMLVLLRLAERSASS